jgi:predicted metal-dependent peptidase
MARNAPNKVAEDLVRAARGKVSFVRPYFSHAIFSLVLVESKGCPSMSVDEHRRLYYNPAWVSRWSVDQLATVMIHELGHNLRDHHRRAKALGITHMTYKTANIAMDAELNDDIRDEMAERGDLPQLPGSPYYPADIGCADGDVWEVYYAHMMDNDMQVESDCGDPGGGQGQGQSGGGKILRLGPENHCGSAAHGVPQPWEHGDPGTSGQEGVSDADWRDVVQLTAEAIRDEVAKGRGTVPGGWKEWSKQILKPKRIPWEHEVQSGLRWAINDVAGMVLHSYKRPSRRASALPDFIMPSMRRPIPFVCIVGDTSGSMHGLTPLVRGTVEDLCTAVGARVAFLATDAQVHGGVQMVRDGKRVELRGGGGTSMTVGMEYAVKNLRPRPDVLVVITDCETDWPAKAPRGARTIVCALGDSSMIDDVPKWARLIRVRPNDE